MFTIGTFPYLNVLPFFVEEIFKDYQLVIANPRTLGRSLNQGTVSAAPIPVIDFWRFSDNIEPLGHLGIAAKAQTHSVLLFSKIPPEELDCVSVAVTPESSTSVRMLWILLHEKWHIPQPRLRRSIDKKEALLLIGNAALKGRKELEKTGYKVYDLSEIWYASTGYPFVFARWAVHRSVPDAVRIDICKRLEQSLTNNLAHLEALYKPDIHGTIVNSVTQFVIYLSQFTYHFGEAELQGMELFRKKVMDYGLLDLEI